MILDASVLIIFGKLNKLDLLRRVYGILVIAPNVYQEVVEAGQRIGAFEAALVGEWIEKKKIEVRPLNEEGKNCAQRMEKIYTSLGKGEIETISLALQEKEKAILMDERIGRKTAALHGIKAYGSLKVMLLAFKKEFITEEELKRCVTEMTASNFRVSAEVINLFWSLFEKMKKKG